MKITASRRAACLGVAFLVAGCMSGAGSPSDGTWIEPPKDSNFNNPANWSPYGVPTGTATIPRNDVFPPTDFIEPSSPMTTLGAIRHMNGKYVFLMDPGENVTLRGDGLTVCCQYGWAIISAELTGKVTVGAGTGLGYGVSGAGRIKNGDVTVLGGAFGAGGRIPGPGANVLTVERNVTIEKGGMLYATVLRNGVTTRLDVEGGLIANGGPLLLIDATEIEQAGPPRVSFVAARAKGGITGRFGVKSSSARYSADATYSATEITVTMTRLSRPQSQDPADVQEWNKLHRLARGGNTRR